MSDIICVTNRLLCRESFLLRVQRVSQACPHAIILREKDLSGAQYEALARAVLPLCVENGVPLVLNGHPEIAVRMGLAVQLPFARRDELVHGGISVHSSAEAAAMRDKGADWLIAGHVWDTACKADIPGRGTALLHAVSKAVDAPVYAIGGVTPERMPEVYAAGAVGACVMSMLMTCEDPAAYLKSFAAYE